MATSVTQLPSQGLSSTEDQAGELYHKKYDNVSKYSRPTKFAAPKLEPADKAHYNENATLPAKYSTDNEAKDRMSTRQALINAAPDKYTAQITEEHVDYMQQLEREADTANFDDYITRLVDFRKPGNLQWIMNLYPGYVERRVKQMHDDHDYALRSQMIDNYGINTFEDLYFQYMKDAGMVNGPHLSDDGVDASEFYKPGKLSFLSTAELSRTSSSLPFNASRVGRQPDAKSYMKPPYGRVGGQEGKENFAKIAVFADPEVRGGAYPHPLNEGLGRADDLGRAAQYQGR